MMNRVLVIAPHPDDEVLGCGGVMARLAGEGKDVFVGVVSNHDAPLYTAEHRETTKAEARRAHEVLGVKETVFLDFAAVTLKDLPVYELNGAVAKLVRDIAPDTVFVPHAGDMHIDHTLVAQAALVAVRPLAACPVQQVFAYETLSETEWNAPRVEYAFLPNVYVDITDTLERKLEAMSCFASQLYDAPHPRSLQALRHLAGLRGSTISVPAAEAFSLVRSVIRR